MVTPFRTKLTKQQLQTLVKVFELLAVLWVAENCWEELLEEHIHELKARLQHKLDHCNKTATFAMTGSDCRAVMQLFQEFAMPELPDQLMVVTINKLIGEMDRYRKNLKALEQ